jgi:hypothetical protein
VLETERTKWIATGIESIPYLNENELIKYLDAYNLQFLYQKTGFLLEHYKDQFQLSICVDVWLV